MVDDPVAREYGRLPSGPRRHHIVAYARRSRSSRASTVGKLLPIPDISNKRFPEAKKHEHKGLHQVMYRMSPDDYREDGADLEGPTPEDGSELRVCRCPPAGGPVPLHPAEPQLTSPVVPMAVDAGL